MEAPGNASVFREVKQFSCPNCGGMLKVYSVRTRVVGCEHCGSELDARTEPATTLLKLNSAGQHPPYTRIRLGMEARFDDETYVVVGRTRWHQVYWEYWSEVDDDGSTEWGYEKEEWDYDEWLLLGYNRDYFYLTEDREGFAISQEIVPLEPSLPEKKTDLVNFLGRKPQRLNEFGEATVVHHEGESGYLIPPGLRKRFGSYTEGRTTYGVEAMLEERTDAIREVEFFLERPLSDRACAEAFGLVPGREKGTRLSAAIGEHEQQFSSQNIAKKMLAALKQRFLGQCLCVGALVLLMLMMGGRGNEVLATKSWDLQQVADDDDATPLGYAAFEAAEGDQIKLEMAANLSTENSAFRAYAEVLQEDSVAVRGAGKEFWREAGTEYECDDEGCGNYAWSEQDLSYSERFRVDSTGRYLVLVMADADQPVEGLLSLRVLKSETSSWYMWGLLLLGLPGAFLWLQGASRARYWGKYSTPMPGGR